MFWEASAKSKGKILQNCVAFSGYMNFIAQVLSSHYLDYKFLQKWEFCKNLRSDDFYWDQEQVSALITSAVSDQL